MLAPVLVLLAFAPLSSACSCAGPQPICTADRVLKLYNYGSPCTPNDVGCNDGMRIYHVEIQAVFDKEGHEVGSSQGHATVVTPGNGGMCGLTLPSNEQLFLVGGKVTSKNGHYEIDGQICDTQIIGGDDFAAVAEALKYCKED